MNRLPSPDPLLLAKIALGLVLGALLALGGVGCGDGSGQADSPSEKPSAEFLTPGGDNSIQTFGREAGNAERRAASTAIEVYMIARSEQNWELACARLSAAAIQTLAGLVGPALSCPASLAALYKRVGPSSWASTMTGPIAALRSEGDRGFALYHGRGGVDYFMQMSREGGDWKVAALEPITFF